KDRSVHQRINQRIGTISHRVNHEPTSFILYLRHGAGSLVSIKVLTDLFILRGVPAFIRSDNDPEFVAQAVRDWIAAVGAKTAYIVPGSPWEHGYCESFNARFREELLNGEIFYRLKEVQIIIEEWRKHYNTKRPHSALGYRPPAPETIVPMATRPVMH
ncbi:MAG: integrase core domain-containing protein, partial [Pseudomonadota bacterium]